MKKGKREEQEEGAGGGRKEGERREEGGRKEEGEKGVEGAREREEEKSNVCRVFVAQCVLRKVKGAHVARGTSQWV